jgi:hypothetical protein
MQSDPTPSPFALIPLLVLCKSASLEFDQLVDYHRRVPQRTDVSLLEWLYSLLEKKVHGSVEFALPPYPSMRLGKDGTMNMDVVKLLPTALLEQLC